MKELKINVKSVSGKKCRIVSRGMLFDESISDVKGLIEAAVKICVDEYNSRREGSDLLEILSPQAIEDKASLGKISFGENHGKNDADPQKAIADALEAFSDGIVVIFADNKKLESINEPISILDTNELTFVKLTMLAGRMW